MTENTMVDQETKAAVSQLRTLAVGPISCISRWHRLNDGSGRGFCRITILGDPPGPASSPPKVDFYVLDGGYPEHGYPLQKHEARRCVAGLEAGDRVELVGNVGPDRGEARRQEVIVTQEVKKKGASSVTVLRQPGGGPDHSRSAPGWITPPRVQRGQGNPGSRPARRSASGGPQIVLFSGSLDWTDRDRVRRDLEGLPAGSVVIEDGERGLGDRPRGGAEARPPRGDRPRPLELHRQLGGVPAERCDGDVPARRTVHVSTGGVAGPSEHDRRRRTRVHHGAGTVTVTGEQKRKGGLRILEVPQRVGPWDAPDTHYFYGGDLSSMTSAERARKRSDCMNENTMSGRAVRPRGRSTEQENLTISDRRAKALRRLADRYYADPGYESSEEAQVGALLSCPATIPRCIEVKNYLLDVGSEDPDRSPFASFHAFVGYDDPWEAVEYEEEFYDHDGTGTLCGVVDLDSWRILQRSVRGWDWVPLAA